MTTCDLVCVWCLKHGAHVRTRMHDDGTEWRCLACGQTQVSKRDDGTEAGYVFFPGDIYRALNNDVEPLHLPPRGSQP